MVSSLQPPFYIYISKICKELNHVFHCFPWSFWLSCIHQYPLRHDQAQSIPKNWTRPRMSRYLMDPFWCSHIVGTRISSTGADQWLVPKVVVSFQFPEQGRKKWPAIMSGRVLKDTASTSQHASLLVNSSMEPMLRWGWLPYSTVLLVQLPIPPDKKAAAKLRRRLLLLCSQREQPSLL